MSLEVLPKSGHFLESDIERIKIVIEDKPRLTAGKLSAMLGCNQSTINGHLHDIGKVNILGTRLSHHLTSDSIQKNNHYRQLFIVKI